MLLHRLVDDLYQLSLSDVGGLKYHFSQLDISSALENVCSSLQSKAQGKDIIITPNIQENVVGLVDPQRIEQLFINLINNAIIHTNAKGSVQIALSQKGNAVVFEINDTLPSVPFEDCEKLFDPLYRQNASRNRATPGAGLGLTICKNIVNAHRGSIHATQSALGGLCVTVKIPLTKEPA
ncbi:ATP-binding protein [Paraglaciecola sp. Hal342]